MIAVVVNVLGVQSGTRAIAWSRSTASEPIVAFAVAIKQCVQVSEAREEEKDEGRRGGNMEHVRHSPIPSCTATSPACVKDSHRRRLTLDYEEVRGWGKSAARVKDALIGSLSCVRAQSGGALAFSRLDEFVEAFIIREVLENTNRESI